MNDVLLFVVVAAALAFDFTNGFHDTANAMATTIATKALPPKQALGLAASLNFVGAFLSISVAATIAKGIVDQGQIALPIIFAGLLGAIGFNLTTWYLGLPSSSSHALIGGMVGAMVAAVGTGGVEWSGILESVLIPGVFAVLIAGSVAVIGTKVAYLLPAPDRRRHGHARLPAGADRLGVAGLARARHERRAEDDGHHRARAGRERQPLGRQLHGPAVGQGQLRDRDRARDLHGRLADHRHARQEGHR